MHSSTVSPQSAPWLPCAPRSAGTAGDYIVPGVSVVGTPMAEIDRILDGDMEATARLDGSAPTAGSSFKGLRSYLTDEQGRGYWDIFRASEHLFLSVTDAHYNSNAWIEVPADRAIKIRILLSGRLCDSRHRTLIDGPGALLHFYNDASEHGYFLAQGLDTRMVVLHCRPELLTQGLRLEGSDIPPPLDAFFANPTESLPALTLRMSAELLRAASDIVASRYYYANALRGAYLHAKCHEIICNILQALAENNMRAQRAPLPPRDINRLYEARDLLQQQFRSPPTIPRIARMVGINQTKLKSGFKKLFGLTVYEFVQHCRMQRATELLLAGEQHIAEIAYAVGYEHAANFTYAFKSHFGYLPSSLKQARSG